MRAVMVSDEASCALVPGVGALDDPSLCLDDEARCGRVGPERLLLMNEGAGGAMTHDVDRESEVGLERCTAHCPA